MKPRIGRLAVAAVVATAATGVWVVGARAEAPAATGWWWAGQVSADAPSLSEVPSVPEGGLYVANTPASPTGVSALLYEVPEDAEDTVLTLAVHEAVGTPAVQACAAIDSWEAVEGGAWDERPGADCSLGFAVGELSDDEKAITFELDSLLNAGVLEVVLIPHGDVAEAEVTAFSVTFEAPGDDALAFDAGFSTTTSTTRPDDPDDPTTTTTGPPTTQPPSSFDDETYEGPSTGPVVAVEPESDDDIEELEPVAASGDDLAGSLSPQGFAYAVVLVLPLVFLVGGSWVAFSLTRPLTVLGGPNT